MSVITDSIRLEISTDPPAGALLNLLSNPTGERDGAGWETPFDGDTLSRLADVLPPTMLLRSGGLNSGSATVVSAQIPVTPGRWVGTSWLAPTAIAGQYRVRLEFLKADKSFTTVGDFSAPYDASAARRSYPAMQVPADAAFVVLRIWHHAASGPTGAPAGAALWLRDVMLAQATTAAAVTNPAYAPNVYWTDVTASCSGIDVVRAPLDLGTLSATFLDNSLDPNLNTRLAPNRRMRLLALINGVWEQLLDGTMQRPTVTYDKRRKALGLPKAASIAVTATDPNQKLAALRKANGVVKLAGLPHLLEGADVPWNVGGVADQIAAPAAADTYVNDGSTTVLEHVRRTRNTHSHYDTANPGYVAVWIDRFGTLQAWASDRENILKRTPLTDPTFRGGVAPWSPGANTVLSWLNGDATYGTCLRATAQAAGDVSATIRVPVRDAVYALEVSNRFSGSTAMNLTMRVTWLDRTGAVVKTTPDGTFNYSTPAGAWRNTVATMPTRNPGVAEAIIEIRGKSLAAGQQLHVRTVSFFKDYDLRIDANDYLDADSGPDDEYVVNSITLDSIAPGTSGEQSTSAPLENGSSVVNFGRRGRNVETAGAAFSLGDSYLFCNAVPEAAVRSLELRLASRAEIDRFAGLDLYDRLYCSAPIFSLVKIAAVRHVIRPTKRGGTWRVEVETAGLKRHLALD